MKSMSYLACMTCAAVWTAVAGQAQELRPMARPAAIAAVEPNAAATAEPTAEPVSELIAALPEPAPEVPALSPAFGPALGPALGPTLGPETNLPLPRYVSLKTDEGNVRRGPSMSHRIDWVFLREDMPLQIVAEYGHWRRVVDSDGVGGWMNYSMLSGNRTVLVQIEMQPVYGRPDLNAPQNAILEQGVVAELGQCQPDWCWISSGGYRGWVPKSALWGVDATEVRD